MFIFLSILSKDNLYPLISSPSESKIEKYPMLSFLKDAVSENARHFIVQCAAKDMKSPLRPSMIRWPTDEQMSSGS
jgi:hypothetical protein